MFAPGERIWAQVASGLGKGLWLHVDLRYEEAYLDGQYEPEVQRTLADRLKPGGTIYDVGAHIGFFSLIAARVAGREGAVFAFEADLENAARIEEHVRKNGLTQVQVVPLAVWFKVGSLRFARSSKFSSRNQGSVAGALWGTSGVDSIQVEATTLDSYARDHRPPTLIKVDVEGSEAHVLEGAQAVLSEAKPVLLCEVHHSKHADEVENLLRQRGYAAEWLTPELRFPRHLLARIEG